MKKLVTIFLLIIFIANTSFVYGLTENDINCPSAILIDGDSGEILFSKNPKAKMYPASLTKILTGLIILEDCNLDDIVTIDKSAVNTEPSIMGLKAGEKLTVEQLLYGLMIKSANDGARALAIYHSGSYEKFAEAMNAKAKSLGALDSNFVTPNGLHNSEHYTTAYDMSLIAMAAMKNEKFRELVKTTTYEIPATNKDENVKKLYNKNRFFNGTGSKYKIDYKGKTIDIKYEIVDGIKTGYTSVSRQCFAGSAFKDNKRLISIVLKGEGKDVWVDSRTLLDYGFDNFTPEMLLEKNTLVETYQVEGEKNTKINLYSRDDIYTMVNNNYDKSQIKAITSIDKITLPVEKGASLGTVAYYFEDHKLGETDLVSPTDITGQDIIAKETVYPESSKSTQPKWMKYLIIFSKVILTIFVWRVVMTMINLKKRKKKKKVRKKARRD